DHIVDHGSVRNYVSVKRRLFRDLAPGPASPPPVAILNTHDPYLGAPPQSLGPGGSLVPYEWTDPGLTGRNAAAGAVLGLWADRIESDADGTCLVVHGLPDGPATCPLSLHRRVQ